MRIDAYNQVQQIYNTKQTRKLQKEEKAGFQDQLQISSKGQDIQVARHAVENVADIRSEVVGPLKSAIKSGTYEVSADAFAAHIFQKYNEANLGSF